METGPSGSQRPDLNITECVWETKKFEEGYIHRRSVVSYPRCLEQRSQPSSFKTYVQVYLVELMLSWRQRVITANIDLNNNIDNIYK